MGDFRSLEIFHASYALSIHLTHICAISPNTHSERVYCRYMEYTARTFNFATLADLSKKQLDVHLELYAGYVKHTNLVREKIAGLADDPEANALALAELRRHFAFEFDGMRMHEYYFEQFEGSATPQSEMSALAEAAEEKYGSYEGLETHVREVASTRGVGWAVVYYDPIGKTLHTVFTTSHELGQLAGLPIILALDMWEHAYMVDYAPSEKSHYLDAFFKNLNWSVPEGRFLAAQRNA